MPTPWHSRFKPGGLVRKAEATTKFPPVPPNQALTMHSYSPETKEVIALSVSLDALERMVNHSLFEFLPLSDGSDQVEARFKDAPHLQLFYIRLLDFALEGGSKELFGEKISCLDLLKNIGNNPKLSTSESARDLSICVTELRDWLETVIHPNLWLAEMDINVRLSVTRLQLLKITGNQAKHNLGRLTGVAAQVRESLKAHGHEVAPEAAPFALEGFREHLEQNLFIYYGSWLAELINNLTWAIYRYILPIYNQQVIFLDGPHSGSYRYKPLMQTDLSSPDQAWLYRLLNEARHPPAIERFRAPSYLKQRAALEWEDE